MNTPTNIITATSWNRTGFVFNPQTAEWDNLENVIINEDHEATEADMDNAIEKTDGTTLAKIKLEAYVGE